MKRYTYNGDLTATDTGELVLFSDADAEIAALRARVAELDSQLDKLYDKYTDLDAENAGLCVLRDQLQARVAELERTVPAPARAVVEAADIFAHPNPDLSLKMDLLECRALTLPLETYDALIRALAAFRAWEKGEDDGK